MILLDDLEQTAEDLRKLGLDVCHEFVYSLQGCLEGLDVGEDFFPLWELRLAENHDALERLDFPAIKAHRSPGWSLVPQASRET